MIGDWNSDSIEDYKGRNDGLLGEVEAAISLIKGGGTGNQEKSEREMVTPLLMLVKRQTRIRDYVARYGTTSQKLVPLSEGEGLR